MLRKRVGGSVHDPIIGTALAGCEEAHVDWLRSALEEFTSFGPRGPRDAEALTQALAWIRRQLEAWGYHVEQARFADGPGDVNLIAERTGTANDTVIEVGAHFDTVPCSPGADDNGSGVVGLLALARLLSTTPLRRRVRLCFYGREESGLIGSRAHVCRLDAGDRTVVGTIVFEMIGFRCREPNSQRTPIRIPLLLSPPRTGDFLAVLSNYSSSWLATALEQAAAQHVPELRLYTLKILGGALKDAVRSDHASYWRSRRSAIMLTDTANFRNPHYHSPTDTTQTVDYTFVSEVTRATAATVLRWALG